MDNPVANLNVYQVIATDKDPGPGNKLSYKIVDGNNDKAFTIEEFTGKSWMQRFYTWRLLYNEKLIVFIRYFSNDFTLRHSE